MHHSNQTVQSETKLDYAEIGIEEYFNEKKAPAKIDPNITEDSKLDAV